MAYGFRGEDGGVFGFYFVGTPTEESETAKWVPPLLHLQQLNMNHVGVFGVFHRHTQPQTQIQIFVLVD